MTLRRDNVVKSWIIPTLIALESNVQHIPDFVYGERFSQGCDAHSDVKVRYYVQRDLQNYTSDAGTMVHKYYRVENEQIYYEQSLGMGPTLKLVLRYSDPTISIMVNPLYHHLIRRTLPDIRPPGNHLSDVLGIKLLTSGYAPLHASAFSINHEATVICAPSDTGKTVSVLHAVSRGCDFMSEDIAVTNGTHLWGCPHTFGLAPHAQLTGVTQFAYRIYQHVPILRHFLRGVIDVNANVVLGADRISSHAEVKRLLILVASIENSSLEVDTHQALSTLVTFNRQEFPYQNPLIFALHRCGKIDLPQVLSQEKQILRDVVHHADEVLLLKGQPHYFKTCIDTIIKNARAG
jgi:hypothetical protein